jgi:hypothetical protein
MLLRLPFEFEVLRACYLFASERRFDKQLPTAHAGPFHRALISSTTVLRYKERLKMVCIELINNSTETIVRAECEGMPLGRIPSWP